MFLGTYRLYRTDNAEAPRPATSTGTRSAVTSRPAAPGTPSNGARGLRDQRGRRGRRRRRGLHRVRRRQGLRQPARGHRAGPARPDAKRMARTSPVQPAQPPGVADRGGPLELADRLPLLRRLQRRDADRSGHVFKTTERRPAPGPTSATGCRTCPPTRWCSTRRSRTRCTPAPTSASSSPPTAAARGAGSAAETRRCRRGSSTSTPSHRLLINGTHGRGAYSLTDSAARLRR